MQKKNAKQIITIIALLVIIAVISSLGLYAWAKYIEIQNSSATAQIAKWSFKVNGSEGPQFATINLANTSFAHVLDGKIAPGTNGAFDLVLDASGTEVSLDYYITLDVTERTTNMKFYTDAAHNQPLSISSDGKLLIKGTILKDDTDNPVTETIYWDWAYESKTPVTEIVATTVDNEAKVINELKEVARLHNVTLTGTDTANEIIAKLNTAKVANVEINDAIDTAENGKNVNLGITVMAEQKSQNVVDFTQGSIEVISPNPGASATCMVEDEVIVQVNFSEAVYAGTNQISINETNAPQLKVKFGTGTEQTATFVGVSEDGTGIKYKVKPTKDDRGTLTVTSYIGNVYNASGTQYSVSKKDISEDKGITATEVTVTIGGITYNQTTIVEKYGELVNYNTGSSTFRLFYVDFENKFGDGYGTIYLKSDQVDSRLSALSYSDATIFKQLNPKWANSSIKTINEDNEKVACWLADPTQWTAYGNKAENSYVNYAIGAPTVELYLASYNQSFGTKYTCQINEYGYGYQYSTNGGSSYDEYADGNTLSTLKNGMYCKSGQYWWLASPSGVCDFVCTVDGGDFALICDWYEGPIGVCPLVSLKSNTPLNFK